MNDQSNLELLPVVVADKAQLAPVEQTEEITVLVQDDEVTGANDEVVA